MDLYIDCSNYSTGVKNGSPALHRLIGKNFKNFLCNARRPTPWTFGMQLHLMGLHYQYDCSNFSPGVKNHTAPGLNFFYLNREKLTRAVVGQRSSPAGYILYCNIFIIKKFKMYNNNKTQTQKAKSLKHEI